MDKFFAKKPQTGQTMINTSSKAADHEMKDESTAFEAKPKFTPWVEK